MSRTGLLILMFFICGIACLGQDTIRVEPSYYYSSDKEPNRGKDFYFRVKYAREDIVYSDTLKRIEYCYYYDNERYSYGKTYHILSDSTFEIDGVVWHYQNQGDRYFVERYFNNLYERGFVKTLMPFETTGTFATMTAEKIDTLWTTDYSTDKPSKPYDRPSRIFHKSNIEGKVYTQNEIDVLPTLLNGDTLTTIHLDAIAGCYSEPLYYLSELQFVITSEGRIVNVEASQGFIDLDFCPEYFMQIVYQIYEKGQFTPAKRKGQNVNVLWKVKVV
jgi:hypothetical protein